MTPYWRFLIFMTLTSLETLASEPPPADCVEKNLFQKILKLSSTRFEGVGKMPDLKNWREVVYPKNQVLPPTAPLSFRIIKKLGSGEAGTVWETEVKLQDNTIRIMTLKEIPTHVKNEINPWASYENHGYTLYRNAIENDLNSLSFTVPVHGIIRYATLENGERVPRVGYLSEKAGPTVAQLAKHFLFSPEATPNNRLALIRNVKLIRDVLIGIGQYAQVNLAHRDIKPENIVIYGGKHNTLEEIDSNVARFKVVDLAGISSLGEMQRWGAGSRTYADPHIDKIHFTDSKSDLFSLGTIPSQYLTGFYFNDPREIIIPWLKIISKDKSYAHKPSVLKILHEREQKMSHWNEPVFLQLFQDMTAFIDIALPIDIESRYDLIITKGTGLIQLSDDAQVLGPGDLLLQHLEEAEKAPLNRR